MTLTVSVIGDALLDVALVPSEPMRPGGDVPAAVRISPGGQGANLAVRLARRGVAARLACGLGEDAAGRLVREALEAEGVSVHAVSVAATGAVAILLDAAGERTMLSQRAPFFQAVDVADLTTDAAWLVISGYALLEDGAVGRAAHCATLPLRRAILGCDVPAASAAHWRRALTAAQPDLVVLNTDEARALAPAQDGDAAWLGAALADDFGALVLVTGPERAAAAGAGLRLTVDMPRDGGGAVDATGAGDAFAAAVLAASGGAWPPDRDALRVAMTEGIRTARAVVAVSGAQGRVEGEPGVAKP